MAFALDASVFPSVKGGQGYKAVTIRGPKGGAGWGRGIGLQDYPACSTVDLSADWWAWTPQGDLAGLQFGLGP